MKSLRHIFAGTLLTLAAMLLFSACIEDGISTSASDQPSFSTDTLALGDLFTLDPSPTHRFVVYNRHDKGITISRIAFSDDPDHTFRLNVDGVSGREFNNIDIRANDSIFVFVEATLPENGNNSTSEILAHIEFVTNGVTQQVPVTASGRDIVRLMGDVRYASDTRLVADKPYHIFDSLVVEQGATLTIDPGVELYFHDASRLVVHGTLRIEGTAEHQVNLTGNRTGYVAASIPYEIMSGQWGGIEFTETSTANYISHASIRNSTYGLTLDHVVADDSGNPGLTLINSQVRNTQNYIIDALHSDLTIAGCELADASTGILHLVGGSHIVNHATIANYYLFTALGGEAVQLDHLNGDSDDTSGLPYLKADFTNCILYGNGTELSHGDLTNTDVYLRRCLLKSAGEDDDHFLGCLWDTDPIYYTVREEYLFDYRLKPDSPAIGAATPEFTLPATAADRYGVPRTTPSLGAYEPTPSQE
jgi:hypothetical protein